MGYAEQVELHASDPDTYRRLTGEPDEVEVEVPKVPAPTFEEFARMGYTEQVAVHRDHPELFEQFSTAEQR